MFLTQQEARAARQVAADRGIRRRFRPCRIPDTDRFGDRWKVAPNGEHYTERAGLEKLPVEREIQRWVVSPADRQRAAGTGRAATTAVRSSREIEEKEAG